MFNPTRKLFFAHNTSLIDYKHIKFICLKGHFKCFRKNIYFINAIIKPCGVWYTSLIPTVRKLRAEQYFDVHFSLWLCLLSRYYDFLSLIPSDEINGVIDNTCLAHPPKCFYCSCCVEVKTLNSIKWIRNVCEQTSW